MIAEASNWFFATFVINLLSEFVLQYVSFIKFHDAIFFHHVIGIGLELIHWSKRVGPLNVIH